MSKLMFAVAVFAALVIVSARGEDEAGGRTSVAPKVNKPKADADAPKAGDTRAVTTASKTGTLGEKPVNAADGVVAVLHVKTEADVGKREGTGRSKRTAKAPEKEETINLMAASPDLAAKLKELTAKSAAVTVTGSLSDDTMKVTDVTLADDKTKSRTGRDSKENKANRRKAADQ